MLSPKFYRYPLADSTSAFFGGRAPLLPRLPLALELPPSPKSGDPSRFVDKFSNEITTLNLRESQLAKQLAKARKKELSEEEQQALASEHAQIESSKKYLTLILSAIQQSMQTITANFR